MKSKLRALIGSAPSEGGFRKRMRFHQGWWRACVLAENEGPHPITASEKICNTISGGKANEKNFLSKNIVSAVAQTIEERKEASSGMIEEDRLFNNLLSSQPLCFNFFGELKIDTDLALRLLQCFWPEIDKVSRVVFEFSPKGRHTNDNSAFDVAFDVMAKGRTGLVGLECKYTDDFSKTRYDKREYRDIFQAAKGRRFIRDYDEYKASRYNQLFRNQLIAESAVQHQNYDFAFTGLFCHPDDGTAIETGKEFMSMLKDGESSFKVITYADFIANLQKLELNWNQRELSMLLWARYLGTLSRYAYE